MLISPVEPIQSVLWPALVILAASVGVLLLIALGWVWLSHRRRQSLVGMREQLQLVPHDIHEALEHRVLECLEAFEVYHAAHWRLLRYYQGAATPQGQGTLEVMDLRGDPFSRLDNAEMHVTLVKLVLPALDLPKFIVLPKNFWTRTFATGAANDIQFGDAFSRHNTLVGANPAMLRRLFHLPTRTLLRTNREMTLEGLGDTLLLYRYPRTMDGPAIGQAVRLGLDLVQVLTHAGRSPALLRTA